ncbi:tetratricopeptide repeat protein [Rhodobacteraceae bacterium KMM 6894]|nr:tetratricopeptide repeat protein [Rhodobacteraceae bacterium KMM 6894]
MTQFRTYLIAALFCFTLLLAGCQSDEEEAEEHYQSALALLEQGDAERALVELRNVFQKDGFHKESRLLYAQKSRELGRTAEAYRQYLRLIEQYPDTLEARVALAEMAIASNDWGEIQRHGTAAVEILPDQPNVQSINLYLKYRQSVLSGDDAQSDAVAADAQRALDTSRDAGKPDNPALVRIVIDNAVQGNDPERTLAAVDAALSGAPNDEDLNQLKIRLLAETGRIEGAGAHLKKMVDLFPENSEVKHTLIQWYISQDDVDGAESFLRAQAGPDQADTAGHASVIQFLQAMRGPEAAHAEMVRLRSANEGSEQGRFYAGLIASMDFENGNHDKAIADLRSLVEASDAGQKKVRLQIMLAQMLLGTGRQEDGMALVDAILEADASNVAALRMRAAKLIEDDRNGAAIVALRTALGQSPRDVDTLTLMARAHARDGDLDLVGERLALAMEASDHDVPEALRYALFLGRQDRPQVAAKVLEDARRRAPGDIQLIDALANLHLQTGAWSQARAIAQELSAMNTPQTRRAATRLEVKILLGQNRTDESLKLLQDELALQGETPHDQQISGLVQIVQTQIRSGQFDDARTTLNAALADQPKSTQLRMLNATLHTVLQEFDEAESIYRQLIEEFPQSDLPARMLITLLRSTDRTEEARAVMQDALKTLSDKPDLMLMNAFFLESDGDPEGAIAVYERLYDNDSGNLLVANNLASLITTHRDDADSLARAANIIRRLRDTDVPAFQDTYGWISFRRGNLEEALNYLESAARALPGDAMVQYHLGETYAALGRNADARAQLEKALDLAGDTSLPQFDRARQTLAGLE